MKREGEMNQIKIDPAMLMSIHGEEKRFQVVDAMNELINRLNEMDLTVWQAKGVVRLVETVINDSTSTSKIKIKTAVYCDHYGNPKERMPGEAVAWAHTCELVDELAKREGVEQKTADPYEDLQIELKGPAKVLIVTD